MNGAFGTNNASGQNTYIHAHIHAYIHYVTLHYSAITHITIHYIRLHYITCYTYMRHTYKDRYIHIRAYMHTDIRKDRQTDRQTYTHMYTHTYSYMHIRTYTYIYIYTCRCTSTMLSAAHTLLHGTPYQRVALCHIWLRYEPCCPLFWEAGLNHKHSMVLVHSHAGTRLRNHPLSGRTSSLPTLPQ